jgi:hypothetical protein
MKHIGLESRLSKKINSHIIVEIIIVSTILSACGNNESDWQTLPQNSGLNNVAETVEIETTETEKDEAGQESRNIISILSSHYSP